MGRMRRKDSGHEATLLPEQLVGRSKMAHLCLEIGAVSSQHAALRWTGQRWEVRDLASLNGTFVNSVRLPAGQAAQLSAGDVLRFGDASEEWCLVDASAPGTMLLPLDGGASLVTFGQVLPVPSEEDPRALLYTDSDGRWLLERLDEPVVTLVDGDTIDIAGRLWRFYCAEPAVRTTSAEEAQAVKALHLHMAVSRDEEHVELKVEARGRKQDLGAHAQNLLLLRLARERLQDAERGLAETACGWMYKDDLLHDLDVTTGQLNLDVYKIRKRFEGLGVSDPAKVIERRTGTNQLRLGIPRVTITTI